MSASGIAVLTIVNKSNEEVQKSLAAEQNSEIVTVSYYISDDETRLIDDLSASTATFDEARIVGSIPSDDVIAQIFRLLKPSCKLWIRGCFSENTDSSSLLTDLKIQGFKNIISSNDPGNSDRFIYCERPMWEVGTSSGIVIPSATVSMAAVKNVSAWKVTLNADEDEELVDESDLMDDKIVVNTPADCGVDPTGINEYPYSYKSRNSHYFSFYC